MKRNHQNNLPLGKIGISGFFRICVLLLLPTQFCLSQLYISEGTKIFDSSGILGNYPNTENEKGSIYVVEGTLVSNSENINAYHVTVSQKTSNLSSQKHFVKNTKLYKNRSAGRKGSFKQKTAEAKVHPVYKPLDNTGSSLYFKMLQENTAISSSSSFSTKKYGTAGKFEFEIPKVLSHKNQKTFSPENENSIKLPTSHTVRPPPIFCIC
ncbi:hypothetical protein [Chryseobacterium indologenes]|uniref:hypothetical protein n=1 Tax=Chryseobacterium indologenes TaxID=253 RepID=UPI00162482A5|nr:hypothetical protein [Chryseobacterium indologenes]